MTAYRVAAYRGNRNWHLKIADYSRTVSDEEGKPPAREQAEALREKLATRSLRRGFGWTHIDIQLKADEAQGEAAAT
ncbi:hypothetical protein ACWY4P_41145 [Streptomyces sp. LZ34]